MRHFPVLGRIKCAGFMFLWRQVRLGQVIGLYNFVGRVAVAKDNASTARKVVRQWDWVRAVVQPTLFSSANDYSLPMMIPCQCPSSRLGNAIDPRQELVASLSRGSGDEE